jgi:hypothetical protein
MVLGCSLLPDTLSDAQRKKHQALFTPWWSQSNRLSTHKG